MLSYVDSSTHHCVNCGSAALMLFGVVATLTTAGLHQSFRGTNGSTCSLQSTRRMWMYWTLSQATAAILWLSSADVTPLVGRATLVGISGCSWAVTGWVPHALLNQQLTKNDDYDERGSAKGMVIALHNTAMSVPQVIAAIFCAASILSVATTQFEGMLLRSAAFPALAAALMAFFNVLGLSRGCR